MRKRRREREKGEREQQERSKMEERTIPVESAPICTRSLCWDTMVMILLRALGRRPSWAADPMMVWVLPALVTPYAKMRELWPLKTLSTSGLAASWYTCSCEAPPENTLSKVYECSPPPRFLKELDPWWW